MPKLTRKKVFEINNLKKSIVFLTSKIVINSDKFSIFLFFLPFYFLFIFLFCASPLIIFNSISFLKSILLINR